ncbi:PAQR family membrane homeostasis protein TrhA [Alkalibacillus haloalkaliphilus]|uniref:Hemolysin III family protein n=1 Tax=Alkalibacillus haloalkaliphilus TaxID=94136 RepID=A0A511W5K5_9BACI|nr:hemolysin III family protein [Alkalibacillus haloalkaliphilus]GEN45323.1 hemolysin III family protein [Alkalibacillus haloalkaliphilus]
MPYDYSRKEEAANAITHGLGAALSIAGLVILIVFASLNGSPWQVVSVTIYGTTMLLMYLSSTILHSLKPGKAKDVFLFLDHSSIYLFIAGTYTPILLILLRGPVGWTVLGVVWGVAILGIVFKVFFVHRFMVVSTLLYIILGWFIVFVWRPLSAEMELTGLVYLIIGGVLYSVGSIFYMWRGFPYHHAVWHIFVIAGSAFHFFAILFYVVLA